MKGQADIQKKSQNQSVANIQKKSNSSKSTADFEDNRSETVVMRKLQTMADSSAPPPTQKKENNSGLPDQLKSGVEALSGHSMDDVNVHYNSDKPAELNAHAYAQGSDIHLASGQEKHLPHEAWHVAQQKQGRVQPTTQLKGKININDDEGLEHEADVMGAKALQTTAQRVEVKTTFNKTGNGPLQLQTDVQPGSDEFESIEEFDHDNALAEAKVDPKSKEHKEKLAEHKKGGAAMGEEAQIKLQGELTLGAKFNRFFGNESTYSQLLRKVDEYNKSKDVIEKQALLKELKPLARTWLERHAIAEASGAKQDENEKLKRESVYKFLTQTTSNYVELSDKIRNFKKQWESLLSSTNKIQEDFASYGKQYDEIISDMNAYKSKYPPSVNLLYNEEISELNSLVRSVNSGSTTGLDVDYPNYVFKVVKPKINYSFSERKINFEGEITITSPDIISSSGWVKAEAKDGGFELQIIKPITGKFKNKALEINCETFEFEPTYGLVSKAVHANAVLYEKEYKLNSDFGYLTEKGLKFEELHGVTDFMDFKEHKIQAISVELSMAEGKDLSVSGNLHLDDRGISVEMGSLDATFNEQLQLSHLNFQRGKGTYEYLTQEFTLGGLGYDLSKKAVTVEFVERELPIGDYKVTLTSKKGSISLDNELDARIFKGKLKGQVDTEKGIVITDPAVTYDRGASEAESSTTVEGGLSLSIGDDFTATGKVKATFDTKGVKDVTIQEGTVDGSYEGIKLQMTGLSYKMEGEGNLSAKTVIASIAAFDKTIALQFTNARTSKAGFDFDEITASLDAVDFGIIKVTNPTLTYNKEKGAFKAALGYELDNSKIPEALKDSTLSAAGGLEVEWDPDKEENRFYRIEKTDASLKLFGQTLSVKEANYNSKTKEFDTKEATLKMDLGFLKGKELKGEKISFGANKDFDFSEISMEQKEDLEFGVLTLSSDKFLLLKDDKGYKVQTNGAAKLNLPEAFQADSSAKFSGFVGVYLKDPIKPYFELTEGQAELKVVNPLVELAKFLGDGWSKTRFELGASIPVFPGIAAVFGVYIQLLAQMPETIDGTIKLKDDILDLALELKSKLEVEGGVFGGVQAGSQLLIALAVLLRAAAKMGIDLTVGYEKKLPVKEGAEKPNKELSTDDQGFNYALTGELKAGAYLDLVATALYFFQKTFTLELKEWTLGEFEFSNKKKELPKGGDGSQFSDDQLQEHVTPEALQDARVATMKADQLLDQKQNERFSQKQKDEVLTKIKSAEEGRGTVFKAAKEEKDAKKKSGELESGGDSLFNNVAAMNMQFMDKYIDLTVNWEQIHANLKTLGQIDAKDTSDESKAKIKKTLLNLAKLITIPQTFKDHYLELATQFNTAYKDKNSASKTLYEGYLANKGVVLNEVHKFKHDNLHSSLFGDESAIDSSLRSWSIVGESNFMVFARLYNVLYNSIVDNSEALKISQKANRYKLIVNALEEMNAEHVKEQEQKRLKSSKALPTSPKP